MKPLGQCIEIMRNFDDCDSFDRSYAERTLIDLYKTEPEVRSGIADLLDNLANKGLFSRDSIIHRPFGKV